MAKKEFNLFGSLLNTGAKAVKVYSKETERQKKATERAQTVRKKAAEKERARQEKLFKKAQNIPTHIPIGYTLINISSFIKKYIKGAIIPMDLFIDLQQKQLNGITKTTITTSTIEMLDNLLAEKKAEDKRLSQCVSLNNKGSEYEKQGKINLAIKTYEKNIEEGCYPAHHSFKRLMIIYRKNKDYENEERVILRALEVFPNEQEYIMRLEKVYKLKK